jgi:hypothetical protein
MRRIAALAAAVVLLLMGIVLVMRWSSGDRSISQLLMLPDKGDDSISGMTCAQVDASFKKGMFIPEMVRSTHGDTWSDMQNQVVFDLRDGYVDCHFDENGYLQTWKTHIRKNEEAVSSVSRVNASCDQANIILKKGMPMAAAIDSVRGLQEPWRPEWSKSEVIIPLRDGYVECYDDGEGHLDTWKTYKYGHDYRANVGTDLRLHSTANQQR